VTIDPGPARTRNVHQRATELAEERQRKLTILVLVMTILWPLWLVGVSRALDRVSIKALREPRI